MVIMVMVIVIVSGTVPSKRSCAPLGIRYLPT